MVDHPVQKPHWLSRSMPIDATKSDSLVNIMCQNLSPPLIGVIFHGGCRSLVRSMKRWTTDASLNSCGTASSRQMSENRCSDLCTSGIPPHFNTSGGRQSAHGALPFVSDFIAQWTSCSDGGTARLVSVGCCRISKRTDASKDDGWLRTVLKCSIQRFIMSDCLVSKVTTLLTRQSDIMNRTQVGHYATRTQVGTPILTHLAWGSCAAGV